MASAVGYTGLRLDLQCSGGGAGVHPHLWESGSDYETRAAGS